MPVRYFDGLDPLEEDLVLAVYAAGIADGGPNPELIKETIESSTHKNLMAKYLAPERVDQQRQEMLESEQYPVSDSARVLLQGSFRHHYTPLVREYGDEVDTEGI